MPVPGKPRIEGDHLVFSCESQTTLKQAQLHYTSDLGARSKRKWISLPATISGGKITAPKPPAEANTWFLSVTDERGAMVSTEVVLNP